MCEEGGVEKTEKGENRRLHERSVVEQDGNQARKIFEFQAFALFFVRRKVRRHVIDRYLAVSLHPYRRGSGNPPRRMRSIRCPRTPTAANSAKKTSQSTSRRTVRPGSAPIEAYLSFDPRGSPPTLDSKPCDLLQRVFSDDQGFQLVVCASFEGETEQLWRVTLRREGMKLRTSKSCVVALAESELSQTRVCNWQAEEKSVGRKRTF